MFVVGGKVELAVFDAAALFFFPIFRFLFAGETFADCRIAFDADDSAPNCGLAVFGFSFVDRCHALTFVMG